MIEILEKLNQSKQWPGWFKLPGEKKEAQQNNVLILLRETHEEQVTANIISKVSI